MKYFGQTEKSILAECEKCNTTPKISKDICKSKGNNNYDIMEIIKCDKCGNKSNRILKTKSEKKGFWGNEKESLNEMNTHAVNKKGFGIGKAIDGDLVAGSVGLLAGDIVKDKIIINCLKCGHKWKAGKKK